jgi:glyoxylase-like metal-dependent hydrolase (beta-lactamase superfamily II)
VQPYEVYAIRYAHHERRASANFLGGDPEDGPMPIDYFLWLIKGHGKSWVVDTGFDEAMARKRGRQFLLAPEVGLRALDVDHRTIEDVIITHMHHDHAGNHHLFPSAMFHLQDKEMCFATGRAMCHHVLRHAYEETDVTNMVGRVFRNRVCFHDGEEEIAPGLSVHWLGGHTAGIQCVRVYTRRGWLVLASDATHFYANIEQARPFPAVHDVLQNLEAWRKLRSLAGSEDLIIPGHDPQVLLRFPLAIPDFPGIVRLDRDPVGIAK